MKKHFECIHGGKRFKCTLCEETFSSKFSYQRHSTSKHAKSSSDVNIVIEPVNKAISLSKKDEKIAKQRNKIKELKIQIIHTKEEIKKIRRDLLAKTNDD